MPAPASPTAPPAVQLDEQTAARIAQLHRGGASLHTIAAALNRAGSRNPTGVRWHAHAVARHVEATGLGTATGAGAA